MKKKAKCLSAIELSGQTPTEMRILGPGVNRTYDEDIVFDAAAAESVMASYTKRGIRKHFDYAHARLTAINTRDPDPQHQKAAGWFALEVRSTDAGPDLWAVKIQ